MLILAFLAVLGNSLMPLKSVFATGETETRTEYVFETTKDFCTFLYSRILGDQAEPVIADKCERATDETGFAFEASITIPDDEIWVLKNVRLDMNYVASRFLVKKGKLIIEDDSYIKKYDGCFFLVTPETTIENLELRGGTFESGDGTASPLCYDTGELNGNPTEESLGSATDVYDLLKSFIPNGYAYINLITPEEEELTEVISITKWVRKMNPSWVYGFKTWKFKVAKKPETPKEEVPDEKTPENSETGETPVTPAETTPESSVVPSPSTKTAPTLKAPDTSAPSSSVSSVANVSDSVLSTPATLSENTLKKSESVKLTLLLPMILSIVVFFTLFAYGKYRGKFTNNR